MIKLLTTAALALGFTSAWSETVRTMRANELHGIRLWEDNQSITGDPQQRGMLLVREQPRFKNETRTELASVLVRLVVDQDGSRIYNGPEFEITKFDNYCAPHTGSLLPYQKSDISEPFYFHLRGSLWTTHSNPHLEFIGAKTFVKPDLHDAGHLFTYFFNTHDDEVIAKLKHDPSLMKVVNSRGMTITLSAFACCGVPVIKYLLSHGGSIKPSTGGTSIMHMASVNGNPGVQDLALKLGASVNARTKNGNAPIHKAIAMGMLPAWKWLLAHGANPDIPDARGLSPGYVAISEGQAQAVRDLAKAGAHFKARDRRGLGWMEYAVFNEYMLPVVQGLGLGVNDRDPKTGRTVLMYAASTGYPDSESWLLRHGANPDLKDKQGKTAYDYAKLSNTLHSDEFFRDVVNKSRH